MKIARFFHYLFEKKSRDFFNTHKFIYLWAALLIISQNHKGPDNGVATMIQNKNVISFV